MEELTIDWDGFRRWKEDFELDAQKHGNLLLLLKFLKCKYPKYHPEDYYEALSTDTVGQAMLGKYNVKGVHEIIDMLNVNVNAEYY